MHFLIAIFFLERSIRSLYVESAPVSDNLDAPVDSVLCSSR